MHFNLTSTEVPGAVRYCPRWLACCRHPSDPYNPQALILLVQPPMPSLDNAAKFPLNLQNTTLHSYLTDGRWSLAATFLDGAQYHVLNLSWTQSLHQAAFPWHTKMSSGRIADLLRDIQL